MNDSPLDEGNLDETKLLLVENITKTLLSLPNMIVGRFVGVDEEYQ